MQDRSDSEDPSDAEDPDGGAARTPVRTPAHLRAPGTRGTLLSSAKRAGPRESFDIDRYERVRVPRLPSLAANLESAPELTEDEDEGQEELGPGPEIGRAHV